MDEKNFSSIPQINLSTLEKAKGHEKATLVQYFGDSLRDVGFIALKVPGMKKLVDEVNQVMHDYFHQPSEVKMQDWRDNNGQTGFSQMGRETAAGAYMADLKETYFIPPHFNDWPKDNDRFKNVMSEYHKTLTQIAGRVMSLFCLYLGESDEHVSSSLQSGHNLIRLAFYPRPSAQDPTGAVWAAAHTDLNALTLLPPSTVPGLELLTKSGKWMQVVVPNDTIIVNTGEQVEQKTAGLIKATLHRVVNPGGEYVAKERFASIFFASWHSDFSLAPFSGATAEYPDVTVKDALTSRLIEMSTIKNPSLELVESLTKLGLLRSPPQELVKQFPQFF